MPKQKKAEVKTKPKKPSRTLAVSKKLDVSKKARAKAAVDAFPKTEAKASSAKPVVLKLPRTLKKAARACAKAQGLKLRVWIVELIKIQAAKESASSTKSLQTA